LNAFRRTFKYVWPQWPSLAVVIISAIIVSTLLSVSFMTIVPLLKVMMGEEGLHGWVDRKISEHRYGIEFSVPGKEDKAQTDTACFLLVTNVKKHGNSLNAGLKKLDRVVGIDAPAITEDGKRTSASGLLQTLAAQPADKNISIQICRLDSKGSVVNQTLQLNTGPKPFYYYKIEQLMAKLPRDSGKDDMTKSVVFIIIIMLVLTIIRCTAKYFQDYLAQKIVQVGINKLRREIFVHVINMPMRTFESDRPSDKISRIIRDTGEMGKGIKVLLGKALREPLNAAFFMGGAMVLNLPLTLIFLCSAPLTIWMVALFGKKMKKATKKSLMAWSQMLAKLQEVVSSLKIVKVYNRQRYESDSFESINKKLLKQLLKISKVDALTMPVLEVMGMIAGSGALIIGAYWVNKGGMESSEFFALLILLGAAAEAVRKTSDVWNKLQEANAASERVFAIADEPAEYERPDAVELPALKRQIEFKNISFKYPSSQEPVLKNINLTVQAGQTVAVVGPNGSGKTTLANLLPRFYDPEGGQVLIDGIDIKDVKLASLRSQIGLVTQNTVAFNNTISANIAYGNDKASMDQIIDAAKRAFAHEFIEPLPNGYNTVIGEQNVGLSGGQLQRIVIARAILKNPSILIFDEATSQIDSDSEAKIHKAIEQILKNRTCFIIAHRFSTIMNADIIVVMDNGQIIAKGRHDELIKTCKLYRNLYETQLIKA